MSWKQLPDGKEKLEAFLREQPERAAAEALRSRSESTPRSLLRALPWVLTLALLAAAAWLLA